MYTEQFCDQYYMSLIDIKPIYIWGFNMEPVTKESINKAFKMYGSSTYNRKYYDDKLAEAQAGSGWGSDCSGMIFPISKKDNSAKGYYAACPDKGMIATIDLSHSCLVFRGKSPSSITHIGYYCATNGQVMEMASSKTNFQHKAFNRANWNYWGKPSFIDYNKTTISSLQSSTETLTRSALKFPAKGVDVSVYQKTLDYSLLKANGIQYAILKVIGKDGNPDGMFEKHYAGFKNAGLPILGVYNYSYATTVEKAKIDAQNVIKVLNGRKIPVCLDVEDKCQQGIGEKLIDIINAYHSVIEGAGLPFLIYTGLSFYNSFIKPYIGKLNCKDFWIARYYNGYTQMSPSQNPPDDKRPTMANVGWQYTSSLVIPGTTIRLDGNILYKNPSDKSPVKEVTNKKQGVVTNVDNRLRIRNKPIDGDIVGYLTNGDTVNIYAENNGWYRIGDNQWVSGKYIQVKR